MLRICTALSFIAFTTLACSNAQTSTSTPITHDIWSELLAKHVTQEGIVNYKGFIEDSISFQNYLELLSSHRPNDEKWTKEESMAYWINAYNAFTVKLVCDNYPVGSIKEIKRGIPFVNSVWDIKFINIEGEMYDLNYIEHTILRKEFDEPRIHFAIVCASVSCPSLLNEAYHPEKLEAQLAAQAMSFLSDPIKNQITKEGATISKIFSWFKGDFTEHGTLEDFLSEHGPVQLNEETKSNGYRIKYMDYNWELNE